MPPRKVMLVRHAEKLGDPSSDDAGGPNLSIRGFARAAALPTLFMPAAAASDCALDPHAGGIKAAFATTAVPGAAPRFETPDTIVATQDSHHSCRPRQTASPTAAVLGCPFDCTSYGHAPADAARLGKDLVEHARFDRRVVLVVWHHGTIPDVAAALGIAPRPTWPGSDVFDRVWTITFDGAVTLTEEPQRLLFGDT